MKQIFFPIALIFLLSFSLRLSAQEPEVKIPPVNFVETKVVDAEVRHDSAYGFSPGGRYLFVIDRRDGHLTIQKLVDVKSAITLEGKFASAYFSPDDQKIITFYKGKAKVFDPSSGKMIQDLSPLGKSLKFFAWSPDSSMIAVSDKKFTVSLVNAATGQITATVVTGEKKKGFFANVFDEAYAYGFVIFTPDSSKILTVNGDQFAELWDADSGKLLFKFEQKKKIETNIRSLKYGEQMPGVVSRGDISSDGKWIITIGNDNVRLWDIEIGSLINNFDGYMYPRFSPDSRFIGLLNDPKGDRDVRIFDLRNRIVRDLLPKYSGSIVAWSRDGKTFVTDRTIDEGSKEIAMVWNAETGKNIATIDTNSKYCFDPVSTCRSDWDRFSFSPNGKLLMSYSRERVRIFDLENGASMTILEDTIGSASWSNNGEFILGRSRSTSKLKMWRVDGK